MTATPYIPVSPGVELATHDLRIKTALQSCTDVHRNAAGHMILAQRDHGVRDGQALLWQVASWLSGHDNRPTWTELEAGLDAGNFAAVRAVLVAEGVAAA